MKLGILRPQDADQLVAARQKIRTVITELGGGDVVAVRMASAVSTSLRELHAEDNEASVIVALSERHNRTFLDTIWPVDSHSPIARQLAPFCGVSRYGSGSGDPQVVASLELDIAPSRAEELIPHLQRIMERKERGELLEDLRVKNRELQDSLENLRRTRFAKERMESELNIGREIQMSMLPLRFPLFPDRTEFDAYAMLQPAREVGGDFYDLFLIDDHHFCFVVGDVSGKGVPAALFMAVTKTLIKSRASNDLSPGSILSHVNSELSRENESCMFVTLFVAILDLRDGSLVYSNAGHNPPYILRGDGSMDRLGNRHGPIVAAVEGIAYREDRDVIRPAEQIVLYTDGVTEAADVDYNLYSEDRLASILGGLDRRPVQSILEYVVGDVEEFRGAAEPSDDITLVGVTYHGVTQDVEANVLELEIRNRAEEIALVQEEFGQLCSRHDVPDRNRRQLNMVFDELLSNIINYAYEDEDDHSIHVRVSVSGDTLILRITDDGKAFNPFEQSEPETDLSVEDRPIGGLGVHLVKNVMDTVANERHGTTNVITLEKKLTS
jgi:sigma-B regulation protein RsbU (phosphoserine phosphatase)